MLSRLLNRLVRNLPHATAWMDDQVSLSWQEIGNRVRACNEQLCKAGLLAGDIVVTQLPNGLDAVIYSLAINSVGASESPIDVRLGEAFAGRAEVQLGSRFAINQVGIRRSLQASSSSGRAAADRGIAHLILWTSGTTSEPKAVVLKWSGVLANARGKLHAAPQTNLDRRLTSLPLAHAYARTCDFVTWLVTGGVLSAGVGWNAIERLGPVIRPTLINAVPYLIDKLLGPVADEIQLVRRRLAVYGMDELRMLGCGGAALSPARFDQIQRLGITPIQGYGLTETSPVICSASPSDARAGVVGRPILRTKIRIGEGGEIQCRCPGVMRGYFGDQAATERRFTDDGWFRTGDGGRLEDDGMLKLSGRLDEVIVLKTGYKFWPLELERRLSAIDGVRHAIVRACGAGLEAIVDVDREIDEEVLWRRLLEVQKGFPDEPRIEKLCRLSGPLTVEAGQLTVKNTVRRGVILSQLELAD